MEQDRIGKNSNRITLALVSQVSEVSRKCGGRTIFVYADVGKKLLDFLIHGSGLPVVYVTRTAEEEQDLEGQKFIRVPNVPYTRMGQVKVAIFLALSKRILNKGDIVSFLVGISNSGTLDSLIVTEVGQEYEIVETSDLDDIDHQSVPYNIIQRVLDIASELGNEGREGKPVGALFVLGDSKRVVSMSKQLILNPFHGHSEGQRNVLDPELSETIKELTGTDGAFIIRDDGVLESCGTYLKVASTKEIELPLGLGARHMAAAGITAVTSAVAITVSESTGIVTVFRNGRAIVELEKPPVPRNRRSMG